MCKDNQLSDQEAEPRKRRYTPRVCRTAHRSSDLINDGFDGAWKNDRYNGKKQQPKTIEIPSKKAIFLVK